MYLVIPINTHMTIDYGKYSKVASLVYLMNNFRIVALFAKWCELYSIVHTCDIHAIAWNSLLIQLLSYAAVYRDPSDTGVIV